MAAFWGWISGLCSSLPFSPITNCRFYFQFEFRKIIDTCHSCWHDTNIEDPVAPRDRGRPIIPTWLVHVDKLFYTIFFVLVHFTTITITNNSSYFQILRPSENPAKITREGDQEKQPAKLGPFMTGNGRHKTGIFSWFTPGVFLGMKIPSQTKKNLVSGTLFLVRREKLTCLPSSSNRNISRSWVL